MDVTFIKKIKMEKHLFYYPKKFRKGQNRPIGITIVGILNDTDNSLVFGRSRCHKDDKFNYSTGRQNALKNVVTNPRHLTHVPNKNMLTETFHEIAKTLV